MPSWLIFDVSQKMRTAIFLLALCLFPGCSRTRLEEPRPLIAVWQSHPMSDVEEVKAPKLVIYEDGTIIIRAGRSPQDFRYLKGSLPDNQRESLVKAAVAYFGDPEFQPHFDQVQGNDYATTAIVLHAKESAAATTIYGAGMYSVLNLGDRIDFLPEVTGLPTRLSRLLAELSLSQQSGVIRLDNLSRDAEGVPILPSSQILRGSAIIPTPHSHFTYIGKG